MATWVDKVTDLLQHADENLFKLLVLPLTKASPS